MDIQTINKTPFFFIVARGRSGTTMLQNILDASEHVILPTESRLIIHLKQKYLKVKRWDSEKINDFIKDLYKDKKFDRYWNIDKEDLKVKLAQIPYEEITFQLLCKIIYSTYHSPYKKGKVLLLGDKNPTYSIFVKELREIFPEAKFIHLIRDYRDNIMSNVKTFNTEVIPVAAHGWLAYNRYIENEKEKAPHLFYTLKYEELTSNPETQVSKLCHFLNIPFNEQMLEFNKTIKEKVHQEHDNVKHEINEIHPNISSPINTNQINKWKTQLTDNDIELIEYIAGDFAMNYGYHQSTKYNSNLSKRITSLNSLINQRFNLFIIKYYYRLPMFIRVLMSNTSALLFKTFNYKNYFNSADFRYKGNPKE